jgi:hypothetical protein
VPVGVTGHRTQRPRGTPSPSQLPLGPRGRTVANTAAPGSSDRAAGRSWLDEPPHFRRASRAAEREGRGEERVAG